MISLPFFSSNGSSQLFVFILSPIKFVSCQGGLPMDGQGRAVGCGNRIPTLGQGLMSQGVEMWS